MRKKKKINLKSVLYGCRVNYKDNSSFKIAYLTINDRIFKANIKLNIKFIINIDIYSMHLFEFR